MFKQEDGGSIGLVMTVEIASIYVLQWDRTFLEACRRRRIEIILYKRYVDDSVIVAKRNRGWMDIL